MKVDDQSSEPPLSAVLVVEDSERKWERVEAILKAIDRISIVRAETVSEADYFAVSENWDLVVLDVSMDIASNAAGKRIGHDPLGGLQVAEKMFLLGREAPTIILTAFDSFPSTEAGRQRGEILGLEDVQARAADVLGASFLGCVRYGGPQWELQFAALVWKALKR